MKTFVQQVGGAYYEGDYQHWDWAAETALGCLEYAASKYVARWREKGGVKDLQKAASYIRKLQLMMEADISAVAHFPAGARPFRDGQKLTRFLNSTGVAEREGRIIIEIDRWLNVSDLVHIEALINELAQAA